MWNCSSGTVLRHRRILHFGVSVENPFYCLFGTPGMQSAPVIRQTTPLKPTFRLYFEEYSFHSLFVCVSPPMSSNVFFDMLICEYWGLVAGVLLGEVLRDYLTFSKPIVIPCTQTLPLRTRRFLPESGRPLILSTNWRHVALKMWGWLQTAIESNADGSSST